MSKKNILLAITNGLWLIDSQSAEQLGENVAAVLAGKSFWDVDHKAKTEFLIVSASGENATGSYYSDSLKSAKPNSVAVIDISGPIMKHDNCGDPGSQSYQNMLAEANANPNILGTVLIADTPGGTVAGTQSLADDIKYSIKPVVTLAEDLMASAGYWIGSSAQFIFIKNGTTRVGSVGTMLTFADMQPVWEKNGIKFHEIYATASTEKNKDFAEARKGNYDAIKKNTLDPLNNEFMQAVKTNRGAKLNQATTLNGQVYIGQAAIDNGLADAFGNLQDAVNKVAELAGSKANNNSSSSSEINNKTMNKITLTAAHAGLLALFGATIAAGATSVDVELNAENITKLDAALTAGTTAAAELATAKTDLQTATAAKVKAEADLAALKAANPGATTTKVDGSDTLKPAEVAEDDFSCELDEQVAANRKALGLDK